MEQIRAGVLIEDWDGEATEAVEDDPDTDDADETAAATYEDLLAPFGELTFSPANKEFTIDAVRPDNPTTILFVKPDGTVGTASDALQPGEGEEELATARIGDLPKLPVGGIDDLLQIEVKAGAANAALIAREDHRIRISLADTFFFHGESSKDAQKVDLFKFIREIQEGDFPDLEGEAENTPLTAHVLDAANNRSCDTDDCDDAKLDGVPATLPFRLDSTPPDAEDSLLVKIVGDAVKKFASGDTLTDGTLNTTKDVKGKTDYDYADDLKPLLFSTSEALGELKIEIMDAGVTDAKKITTFTLKNSALADPILGEGAVESRIVFEVADPEKTDGKLEKAAKDKLTDPEEEEGGFTGAGSSQVEDAEALVGNKTKTVKVTATDLAGNPGSTLTYEDVYLDIAAPAFGDPVKDVFPSRGLETIEEEEGTFKVTFVLSEDVDSLLVTYRTIEGEDEETERTLTLDGKNLEKGTRRDLEVKGLEDDTDYELSLLAKDPAGNFNRVLIDTFTYDEEYVVPPAVSFKVESSKPLGYLEKNVIEANTPVVLTITALAEAAEGEDEGQTAHTYKGEAVLTVAGNGTIKFSEAKDEEVDLADQDPGVGLLEAGTGWILGKRDVTIVPEGGAPAEHSITVADLSDGDNLLMGAHDSTLVTMAASPHHIELTRASEDEIVQGTPFMVKVAVVDTFSNVRLGVPVSSPVITGDDGFVEVTVTELGVDVPSGALAYTDGEATFAVNSGGHSGELTLTASDVGDRTILGTLTVSIGEAPPPDPPEPVPPPTAPDAPDTLFAQDYKGALGTGDQGGFVMLTWDSSDDHGTLSGYRIYRQLHVNVLEDQTGAGKLMLSEEGEDVDVPWATVDAVPGEDVMRVVVATLDGYATKYGVSAERAGLRSFPPTSHPEAVGGMDSMDDDGMDDDGMDDTGTDDSGTDDAGTDDAGTDDAGTDDAGTDDAGTDDAGDDVDTKRAFTVMQVISEPYELMAETMMRSREAARSVDPTGPVFATLTPEALAYGYGGDVPRFKSAEMERSEIRRTVDAVAATDDLPPAPVPFLRVLDTPGDGGSSITVQWSRSVDDRMITMSVPRAVGANNVFVTSGVEGYRISRRIGDGPWQLLAEAPAGATSFDDETALNGVRYVYKVEVYDLDNQTPSEIIGSAMAVRNNVVDSDGNPVIGLFGVDSRVDFDDFFIFADHFGLTAEDEMFDSAFDLVANNAVDLADFFAFAANFGKEVAGTGKAVPTLAGLNTDARFRMDHGGALPGIGEELVLRVNLEDYEEVRGYGLTVAYDHEVLEFVETRVVDNPLGESVLAHPQSVSRDGEISIAAFGETTGEGEIEVELVFVPTQEIEEGYIEITSAGLQDGGYGLNRISAPVSVRIETRPEVYALENNYPNPFNPATTIKYQLPEAGEVTLEVYNMLGQVVRTLVDREFQGAGRYNYKWDATNDRGRSLSSGVYFYRITAGKDFQSHKRMLLLK